MVIGLLLLERGGQRRRKQRVGRLQHFDPAGLEGDGPQHGANFRPRIELSTHFGHTPVVARRRRMPLHRFHDWLLREVSASLAALWNADVGSADAALARDGASLHDFCETVNAVVRRQTVRAWDCAKAWLRLFPARSHKPMSLALLLTMQTVAIEHGQPLFAVAIGVGLLGLLRPAELIKLRIGDVLLPVRLAAADTMFLQLGTTKAAHSGGAAHQHVRVMDSVFVPFVQALARVALRVTARLILDGTVRFRRAWDLILDILLVPHRFPDGVTPASLRAGGAT